jgi:hypothetical protein
MKSRAEIKSIWNQMKLSCRNSITPEYAKEFCEKTETSFDKKLIYTNQRYRELSTMQPRVDCEDLLVHVCKHHKIEPNQKRIDTSNKMCGEGSRRKLVEEAYLEEESK